MSAAAAALLWALVALLLLAAVGAATAALYLAVLIKRAGVSELAARLGRRTRR